MEMTQLRSSPEVRAAQNRKKLSGLRYERHAKAVLDLPVPERKTMTLRAGSLDGVRKALRERQTALADLVHAVREYRKMAESKPLMLQGGDYAQDLRS